MPATDPFPDSGPDSEPAAWIRLAQTPGVGPATARKLLNAFGSPGQILRAGHAALVRVVSDTTARALCAPMDEDCARLVEASLSWLAQPSNYLVTLGSAAYPPALLSIPDPPALLYARGRLDLLSCPALAMVGSRNATAQGMANADGFAAALSGAGLTIVSGLAMGIDAAAHRGALRGAGSTVAVIGTGADLVYPNGNRALSRTIADEGCILSECALGTPPAASNFPRRNRLISGLSSAVLVVEAAARSGSLITARMAAEQGRDVLAIPGSIHAPLSKGCHALIREGATLVDSVDDVLAALQRAPAAAAEEGGAGAEALPEYVALLAALGHDPASTDVLAARTASQAGYLLTQLLALELCGHVERLPGGLFQRVKH